MSHIISKAEKMPSSTMRSVHRKTSKPMMEKRRRARINQSLSELKDLIVFSTQHETENCRRSKLEKADILEMAVRHLQWLHQRDRGPKDMEVPVEATTNGSGHLEKFYDGFHKCIDEVNRYLNEKELQMDSYVKKRLTRHLTNCLQNLNLGKHLNKPANAVASSQADYHHRSLNHRSDVHVRDVGASSPCPSWNFRQPRKDHQASISESSGCKIITVTSMAVPIMPSPEVRPRNDFRKSLLRAEEHWPDGYSYRHAVKQNDGLKPNFLPPGENCAPKIQVWRPW